MVGEEIERVGREMCPNAVFLFFYPKIYIRLLALMKCLYLDFSKSDDSFRFLVSKGKESNI